MLYAKGIDVEILTPHGFHGDKRPKGEYETVNPLGRVPCLVLDYGTALPESETICEYLEDAYPDPPLHPADPASRARMRLLSRINDIYLVMAMAPLFWVVELPVAYALALTLGYGDKGVYIAIILAESLIGLVGVLAFRRGKWKTRMV